MFRLETGAPLKGVRLIKNKEFLSKFGLRAGDDADFTALLYNDDDEIMATGSLCGNVLKYIAVDDRAQGEGACASIVSQLVTHAFGEGKKHLFLFTKPKNEDMFKALSFYRLVSTADVLMMENTRHGLDKFLDSLPRCEGTAGALVCNCNPFTNGHLYLMETAAKQVDCLHVFVLSEDRSMFPAEDRYSLVKRGTEHIKNVFVHRSEDYLISSATFPTYFLKETADAAEINADLDLTLFAKRIAPRLGITKRFVGTEPFCPVTNAYNERMKLILPQNGVDVVEIPRLDNISASEVRRLMVERNYEAVRKIVPKVTYEHIMGIK